MLTHNILYHALSRLVESADGPDRASHGHSRHAGEVIFLHLEAGRPAAYVRRESLS